MYFRCVAAVCGGFVVATLSFGQAVTAAGTPVVPIVAPADCGRIDMSQGQTTAPTPEIPGADPAPAIECAVTTRHVLNLRGTPLEYKATAGVLLIRDDQERPNASIFYVAYVKTGADPAKRPLTFVYNGGPGGASLWLHMGSFGPMRVVGVSSGAPQLAPNQDTLLDKTDLVFIDAPMTGYSRLVGNAHPADFAGIDPDIRAFSRIVQRYLSLAGRWPSPKYVFGESYGTPRSAGLAAALQAENIALNGVILQSTVLNYNRRTPGIDLEFVVDLTTYAAIAWYHGKVPHEGDQATFIERARNFARGPYAEALMQGDRLASADFDSIAIQVAAFTGLSPQYVKDSHLRITPSRFRAELLRNRGLILGRYDARAASADYDSAAESPTFDPSDGSFTDACVTVFQDYLARTLSYRTDRKYILINMPLNRIWTYSHQPFLATGGDARESGVGDLGLDLGAAMRVNPGLSVFSSNGIYDLGTPFFGAEFDLAHIGLAISEAGRVRFGYYQAGHMVYADSAALVQLRADLDRFYDDTVAVAHP